MLWFMICMALFTEELVPPTKWYQTFTYIIFWPCVLGKWVKENFDGNNPHH